MVVAALLLEGRKVISYSLSGWGARGGGRMRKTHANIKKNLWEFKKTHRNIFKKWKETQPEARSQKQQPESAEVRTNTALLG